VSNKSNTVQELYLADLQKIVYNLLNGAILNDLE